MNIPMFKKALYYYDSGLVFLEDESKNAMFFDVDGKKVTFMYKGTGVPLSTFCTCDHCSIKSKYDPLCSHKLACIFEMKHMYFKKMQKRNGGKQ